MGTKDERENLVIRMVYNYKDEEKQRQKLKYMSRGETKKRNQNF